MASVNQEFAHSSIVEFLSGLPKLDGPADQRINDHLSRMSSSEVDTIYEAIKAAYIAMQVRWGTPRTPFIQDRNNARRLVLEALESAWLELYLVDSAARREGVDLYLFCHIPKCAGSKIGKDFRTHHQDECLAYGFVRQATFWVSKWQRVNDKVDLATRLLSVKILLLHGHIPLYRFRRSGLDQIATLLFTTVRHPLDIVISHVNYILTSIENFPDRPDSRNWTDRLLLERINLLEPKTTEGRRDLAIRILHTNLFSQSYSNLISRHLLPEASSSAPKELLSHLYFPSQCKVFGVDQLQTLYKQLGLGTSISSESKENKSTQFLTADTLGSSDTVFAKEFLIDKDLTLWSLIQKHLTLINEDSVLANELGQASSVVSPKASIFVSSPRNRIIAYSPDSECQDNGQQVTNNSMYAEGAALRYAKKQFGCEDHQEAFSRFKNFHARIVPDYQASAWERSGFFHYVYPVSKMLKEINSRLYVPVVTHDNTSDWNQPVIAKSRKSRNAHITLLKLSKKRHWEDTLSACREEHSFQLKRDILLFRGATTGKYWLKNPAIHHSLQNISPRCALYHFLLSNDPRILEHSRIDIGFNKLTPRPFQAKSGFRETDFISFMKQTLPLSSILEHRYQLVLEGNDVSTSLKAVLASQCVPLMPRPSTESWLLEFNLIPWVHYVPLKPDLSDIIQKLTLLRSDLVLSEGIALAGRQYMQHFYNLKRESRISLRVLRRFLAVNKAQLLLLKKSLKSLLSA